MIRLIQIEWYKLKHYRPFWFLIGMYGLLATVLCSSLMFFMEFIKSKGADFKGFSPTMLPLYDFPDIWQNLSFIASNLKVILAFIVVMSIFNEINSRIVRQNIIDGLSKKEWLGSKLFFIAAIAFCASLLLFLNGLLLGFIYGHPDAYGAVFQRTEFILAYFLDVFTYLTFAMMLTLLIRKGGLVIVGLLMYTLLFEPFVTLILYAGPEEIPEYLKALPDFFPVQSLRNLIEFPFKRYLFFHTVDYVPLRSFLIVLGWLTFNIGTSYLLLTKRDV
ncbi:MAG: ABC-2 type transport system permease protein [Polaribacter sp.]|jgi:ABC-2 type transport system permease protein